MNARREIRQHGGRREGGEKTRRETRKEPCCPLPIRGSTAEGAATELGLCRQVLQPRRLLEPSAQRGAAAGAPATAGALPPLGGRRGRQRDPHLDDPGHARRQSEARLADEARARRHACGVGGSPARERCTDGSFSRGARRALAGLSHHFPLRHGTWAAASRRERFRLAFHPGGALPPRELGEGDGASLDPARRSGGR